MTAVQADAATHNGDQAAPPARPMDLPDVPFGVRDDDVMPFSWAERGLTWLHKQRPQTFADMMLAVIGVEAHTTKTRGGK